ncbi:MAG: transposase [Phycisphaerales bacterium]|nr:MAG: transposase [Phycisphaerales bacterium]
MPYHDFAYQAASWRQARRAVAKVEWRQGELFPRVGFVVTNMSRCPYRVVQFYKRRAGALLRGLRESGKDMMESPAFQELSVSPHPPSASSLGLPGPPRYDYQR